MMKEHEARLTATGIIWLAFTIVSIGTLAASHNLSSGLTFVMILLFTLATALGTRAVWKTTSGSSSPVIQIEQAEKAKRRSRVDQMLDSMDSAELDELRARLMSESDGEAVGLDELLGARERRY